MEKVVEFQAFETLQDLAIDGADATVLMAVKLGDDPPRTTVVEVLYRLPRLATGRERMLFEEFIRCSVAKSLGYGMYSGVVRLVPMKGSEPDHGKQG